LHIIRVFKGINQETETAATQSQAQFETSKVAVGIFDSVSKSLRTTYDLNILSTTVGIMGEPSIGDFKQLVESFYRYEPI
jgi:hypothetical protein